MKTVMDPRSGLQWLSGVVSNSLEPAGTLWLAEVRSGARVRYSAATFDLQKLKMAF